MQFASVESSLLPGFCTHLSKHVSVSLPMAAWMTAFWFCCATDRPPDKGSESAQQELISHPTQVLPWASARGASWCARAVADDECEGTHLHLHESLQLARLALIGLLVHDWLLGFRLVTIRDAIDAQPPRGLPVSRGDHVDDSHRKK